ncbi:MAG: DUF1588 domain-containing protein [Planctomycetota bacterium]
MLTIIKQPTAMVLVVLIAVLWTTQGQVQAVQTKDGPSSDATGSKLYRMHCANCHGKNGSGGTDQFADPLHGDLSLPELTRYIDREMPEADPDLVTGQAAKQVAQFVFDQFYSETARRRNNQPRIELLRLTVDQYRNRVADVVGAFSDPTWWPEERGIKAEYFAARNMTRSRRISEQVDAEINFPNAVPHFDPTGKYESVPKPKKKPANQMNIGYSVYWRGGILAPETGYYRIKVKSKNGFQLYLNDLENPLIDRKVRSDDLVDHEASIFLLAGRMYSLRLDFFSYPKPPAKIQLLWKPPHRPEQVIPREALTPHMTPEVLAISTEFPADDASAGFERGTDVSAEWDQATTRGAIEAAQWIANRIETLARFRMGDDDAVEKAQRFCEQFVAHAFVTELSKEDRDFYVGQHFEQSLSIQDQVKRVVLLTLKSPRFLYPNLERRTDEHRVGAEMAMVLWDSVPDKPLNRLIDKGPKSGLDKREKAIGHLYAMTNNPRARQKLNAFFHAWLSTHAGHSPKDSEAFPDFDEQLVVDMKTSMQTFLERVAWSETSDYRELFQADYLYLNSNLAKFYDLELEPSSGFNKVPAGDHRIGLLTHPYLMTGLAYHKESSPIHRGVFVAKQLLGRRLRQPPNNVKPLTEEFAPDMTTRERVEHQTKEPTCMNCHSVINPLGFSLENFDAVGRFRKRDVEKPIDVTSVYRTPGGKELKLNGPKDLANYLANDPAAQKNFIRQLFRFYTKNDIAAYGDQLLSQLHQRFVARDCRIRELLIDIAMITIEHDDTSSPSSSKVGRWERSDQTTSGEAE